MLDKMKTVAFVPTSKMEAAKEFYSDKLGFKLVSQDAFALVYALKHSILRVTPVSRHAAAGHTVLGWESPDIGSEVRKLNKRGVLFERFNGFQQDQSGVWTSPSGAKVAWFKDPDGNVLSLTEPAKAVKGKVKAEAKSKGKPKTLKGIKKRSPN